ncbi:tRNA lysidine(34) synthetase TilS [Metapseudomonas lalkuanensis]|uniref:tRNA(Ile)-lysidine synthase n=1 Tax=Metapseudomonas lalkuanensis TaxID=2604832 RepID=A0A5J6QP63_9GAMM|nr:tRNA lysidine(34) synthetase TilS [Pseudomonas lalkuanensis]QEY64578.1 tRNA lysidine(34) synthetase TilS [Pseudomonas lalkuanensis]
MFLESRLLTALAPWRPAPAWHVAYSGGLDSTVLLHLLVRLARREALPPISAIHIHHGLQPAADAWPEHCRRVCDELGVPLKLLRVKVDSGPSLERAAREARYAAFSRQLGVGDVLLSAQHRDDQAETLLFRLLRGAGVRGLAGMPESRALGAGLLARPFLQFSRAELEAFARTEGLAWVEDPSNADTSLARNFLRHDVFPVLQARWPKAVECLARSAEHMAEAESLLGELARADLDRASGISEFPWLMLPSLEVQSLASLSPARQRNALRFWLAPLTSLPDSDHWAGWEDLRDAAVDARPVWRLARGELQRADGRLWWLSGDWLAAPVSNLTWPDPGRPLELPGNGRLEIHGTPPAGMLEVRYRQGGEMLTVAGRGRRDLKRLLNESRVPAFVRGRLPLLLADGDLQAIANLPGLDGPPAGNWRLRWTPPTNDQGLSW